MTEYSEEVFKFIELHWQENAADVALALSKKTNLPREFILNQINGFQKTEKKLPFLKKHPKYLFPNSRAVSQSSSEITAKFKASLVSGKKLLDASGGMGIDSYFFSKTINHVSYLEPNTELFEMSSKNFEALNATNIEVHNKKANEFLANSNSRFDWIYLDPDRRKDSARLVKIEDCEPNILELLDTIWQHTEQILLKLSPMLDLSIALKQLPNCKVVHIIAIENDCKELLFTLNKNNSQETEINTINFKKTEAATFSFLFSLEKNCKIQFGEPSSYLYEPNSAILKAGAFKSIGKAFGLNKLSPNTHLYTSDKLNSEFPGRILKVEGIFKPKKGITKKANVICRNFPMKPEDLKKKYKIKDGGTQFLYACSLMNNDKVFILGNKVSA